MLLWRILCLASMSIFVISILVIIVKRFLRNIYYNEFSEDELLKTLNNGNSINNIFFTTGQTRKYIKRYVLCKTAYDKYLVCNFVKEYKDIVFFVEVFNKAKKVIQVIQVSEVNTSDTSKVILLSQKCKYVNIYVKNVEGIELNTNVIKPLARKSIILYSLYESIAFFSFLFTVRHIIIEFVYKDYSRVFMQSVYNYLVIAVILFISVLNYFLTSKSLRKRNHKNRNGGSLEYEFI